MSFTDEKYISLLSSRLQKFKKVRTGIYNFRCPYCGDSSKNKNKTRGYFYLRKNDYNFKCHNCGFTRSFTYFLKDQDESLYKEYLLERYKEGLTGKGSVAPDPEFKFDPPVFKKKPKIDLPTIEILNISHPARAYLERRQIPKKYFSKLYFCENFKEWTNSQIPTFESIENDESRIIIPLINHGNVFGYQGRSLNKNSKVKYITILLDRINPKFYGLDDVNYEDSVYVVEGPFDSMFLNNSIAMVGADFNHMFFLSNFECNFIFVYDNERRNKQIVNRMEKIIDMKLPIVIWPNTVNEKDINDMVLAGHDVESLVKSNTYSDLEAKVKLSEWKRV
jgi:predicted RNA-binding Zn-ribbon protein involved in translation (DUF1610 family)